MTAVALPVTDGAAVAAPSVGTRRVAAAALHVAMPDGSVASRAQLVRLLDAVRDLVAEVVPGATVSTALDLGGRAGRADAVGRVERLLAAPGTAVQRAEAAWRTNAPTDEPVVVDVDARELTIGSDVVPLTFKEFALLVHLLRSARRAVSREELLATVWAGVGAQIGTRTIDVHVRRLREKLGGCLRIVTVRGVGYRCDPTPGTVLVGSGDAG